MNRRRFASTVHFVQTARVEYFGFENKSVKKYIGRYAGKCEEIIMISK